MLDLCVHLQRRCLQASMDMVVLQVELLTYRFDCCFNFVQFSPIPIPDDSSLNCLKLDIISSLVAIEITINDEISPSIYFIGTMFHYEY